jgi:FMN phosphatase YigB (HAD superfamily)
VTSLVVRSFDVFDTLLTRKLVGFLSVFHAVGTSLLADHVTTMSADAYAHLRNEVEQSLRLGGRQPGLREITECVAAELEGADPLLLYERELEVERQLIVAVPGARELVAAARATSSRIIFVSEMYLPTTFISERLKEHGIAREDEPVFVSAEFGIGKANGLYERVAEHLAVQPRMVVHTGDDPELDDAVARRAGLRAEALTKASPSRYEKVLAGNGSGLDGWRAACAGAARLARLTCHTERGAGLDLAGAVAGGLAPIIVDYVDWVLGQADKRNLKMLCFVSRDGEFLLDIARRRRRPDSTFAMAYCYGSRAAWRNAARDPGQSELLREYFRSLVGHKHPWGLVDVGWHARAVIGLRHALGEALPPPTSFYFGLYTRPEDLLETDVETYMFNVPTGQLDGADIQGVSTLIEIICTAKHGTVLGYEKVASDKIGPVLARADNTPAETWGLDELRAIILQYATSAPTELSGGLLTRRMALRAFRLLAEHPTDEEADALGTFPFGSSEDEADLAVIAPRLRVQDVLAYRRWRSSMPERWHAGSIARTRGLARSSFKARVLTREVQQALRAYYRSHINER